MQFRHNSRQLLELNTTPLDDNRHSGIPVHCLRHFRCCSFRESFFDPWIWDPGCVKKPGMNNPDHISESLETIFGFEILKCFHAYRYSRSGKEKFGSGIPEGKNSDLGWPSRIRNAGFPSIELWTDAYGDTLSNRSISQIFSSLWLLPPWNKINYNGTLILFTNDQFLYFLYVSCPWISANILVKQNGSSFLSQLWRPSWR